MKRSVVHLIGVGPGDPRLITVHGLECLRAADVVVYDHLVSSRLLRHARAGAELIDVGKAAPQETAEEAISYLLADKAREGKRVARLKWGDPFVFDRGGEEALYLHEQGVAFEVVPGVPAGTGIAAYAGVPVSYPGGGNTVTLVRGHEDESRTLPDIDWTGLVRLGGTVVSYLGAQQVPLVLKALVAHGWPGDGLAALVYHGTLANQETATGTLAELLDATETSPRREPAMLVVGRVVGFREHLRWFDARPLFGRRVLITRPRDQAAELADPLNELGATTIEAPMIRVVPPTDPGPLLQAANDADEFEWIVFSSANAVDAFMTALLDGSRDVRALRGSKLCAVGTGTAQKLTRYGIKVDLVPDEHRAEGVVAALAARQPLAGARVLLPRADIGRDAIVDGLGAAGASVTSVVAYRTVLDDTERDGDPDVYALLLNGRVDVVTFTSSSAVRNFASLYGAEQVADLLKHTAVAVIGPVTADTAIQLGIPVTIQPTVYTIPALVEAITQHFAPASRRANPDTRETNSTPEGL